MAILNALGGMGGHPVVPGQGQTPPPGFAAPMQQPSGAPVTLQMGQMPMAGENFQYAQPGTIQAPGSQGNALGGHPNFGGYMPQGIARMLSRFSGGFDQMMNRPGFQNMLQHFGLTPDQIQGQGFDPSQLYTRQLARADYRAGNTPLAPGSMIPSGYSMPSGYHTPTYGGSAATGSMAPMAAATTAPAPVDPNQYQLPTY